MVGETATGGGTCPTSPLDTSGHEGTALLGTGGAITLAPISSTNSFLNGATGITSKNGQHFCGIVGEYGADSAFPGAQFASFVDDRGNALPGAPALVPWLNQGTANFTGYATAGAQSPSSPALTVTAMNSYAISAASFNATTGFVTFTTLRRRPDSFLAQSSRSRASRRAAITRPMSRSPARPGPRSSATRSAGLSAFRRL